MSHMGFSLRDLSLGTLKRKLSPNKHANNAKKDEENSLPSGVSGRSELGRDRISSKGNEAKSSFSALKTPGPRAAQDSHILRESSVRVTTLRKRLVVSNISMGIPDSEKCFPLSLLRKLLPNDDINEALQNETEDIRQYARTNIKLFAITLQTLKDDAHVIRALKEFQRDPQGFSDASIPVDSMDECEIALEDEDQVPASSTCQHHDNLNVFHHHPWDPTNRQLFYYTQWRFSMPVLDLSPDHPKKYHSKAILPLIKLDDSGVKGSGHFGDVFKGEILTEYQNEVSKDIERYQIAIKQLKARPDDDFIVEHEWNREIHACATFNKFNHDHILRGIAACKHSDRYYLFLQWADGGNLRTFWANNPKPNLDENIIMELLFQVYGLVDALYDIHSDSEPENILSRSPSFVSSESPSQVPKDGDMSSSHSHIGTSKLQTIETIDSITTLESSQTLYKARADPASPAMIPAVSQEDIKDKSRLVPDIMIDDTADGDAEVPAVTKSSNWRHGDIKPENILVFSTNDTRIGKLKLGDLGRAKKHHFQTGSPHRRQTGEKYGTKEYEPPEAVLSLDTARSRRYDIWAMGCIILESILWLLYGLEKKNTTERTASDHEGKGTKYWVEDPECQTNPKAKVNPTIAKIIDDMLEKDPECCKRSGTALRDLLLLVKDHLLVVHISHTHEWEARSLLQPLKTRCDATMLREKMEEIVRKAQEDSNYLFSNADRTQFRPLPDYDLGDSVSSFSEQSIASQKGPSPSQHLQAPRTVVGQTRDSYAHEERDIWDILDDTHFANGILSSKNFELNNLGLNTVQDLCQECKCRDFQALRIQFKYKRQDLESRANETGCPLCSLFVKAAHRAGVSCDEEVSFESSNSTIKLQGSSEPYLSICQPSATKMEYIRTGLPCVSTPGSPTQISVMRGWLKDCNQHKNCKQAPAMVENCPTRLIDVETDESRVYVVEKASLIARMKGGSVRYVAFSHPWGDGEQHSHYTSTSSNIHDHVNSGIPIENLPNTFQGAIKVARQLGVRYLWIDSLCILQGPGGDFEQESKTMENVYGSAYFTIAASSAIGTSSRLFEARPDFVVLGGNAGNDNNESQVEGKREIARLFTKDKREYFISEYMDRFQADVLNGPLSSRGWVFQERALSRRTIYFTNTQTYWECGEGIRCETLTKLRNPQVRFLGDPNFPEIAAKLSKGGQIYYYESVYEKYSALNFKYPQDRSVAILGLESRICQQLGDKGAYGVFRKNLGRGLLWWRSTEQPLVKIDFNRAPTRGRFAPSWSWMAWAGSIAYMSPQGGSLTWSNHLDLTFKDDQVGSILKATIQSLEPRIKLTESDSKIRMDDGSQFEGCDLKVAVVGKEKLGLDDKKRKYYVMVVSETLNSNKKAEYHRVGVGWILGKFLQGDEKNVCIE